MSNTTTLPMPFWCRLGFHPWGAWSEAYEIDSPFFSAEQESVCLGCGKSRHRYVEKGEG